jgi:holin-like protein
MVMLYAGLALVALQYVGELVADVAGLPVPGVIVGILLLLTALALRGRWFPAGDPIPTPLNRVAQGLHDHFGLLFVPAGAGVVANFDRLLAAAPALLAAVLLSTAVTIAVTALIATGRPAPLPTSDMAAAE